MGVFKLFLIRPNIIFLVICFIILPVSSVLTQDEPNNSNTLKPLSEYELYQDEYSELDVDSSQLKKNEVVVKSTLEKSRQEYLKALILVENNKRQRAAEYFERAIDILNQLVSYPGIEKNEEFTDLAQSIIDDYESFVKSIDELDESSSMFIFRDKFYEEMESLSSKEPVIREIEVPEDTREIVPGFISPPDKLTIPMPENEFVKRSMSFLLNTEIGRIRFNRWLARSTRWFPMMKRIAQEEGMPQEIIYLSMWESALVPTIVSSAKAVGLWQFIRSTGELYGLNANPSYWIDERRDPEKATRAAMIHLRDLYEDFGHWHLALAAYNCGPGCVRRAIRRTGGDSLDFWDIRRRLPKETRGYVPAYIATAKLAMNPEKYGFLLDTINFHDEYIYDTYVINEPVSLKALAKACGITEDEIKDLNPELTKSSTPPDVPNYELKIPFRSYERFAFNYSKLSPDEKQPWIVHIVKRRETITRIARNYGVSRNEIMTINNISSYRHKLKVGEELLIPIHPEDYKEQQLAEQKSKKSGKSNVKLRGNKNVTHTVRRGETLYSIARRYGLRIADLRNLNNIAYGDDNLQVGQKIYIAKNSSGSSSVASKSNDTKIIYHKVRRGETLGHIAENYGIRASSIRRANGMSGSRIIAGKNLKIPVSANYAAGKGSSNSSVHKVRRGETIGTIAARYGLTQRELKNLNPSTIRGNTVFAGTYIKVKESQTSKGSSGSTGKDVDSSPKYYKIRKGDTLISIARKFGVTVNSIKRKNKNLNDRRLRIGQKIRIQ